MTPITQAPGNTTISATMIRPVLSLVLALSMALPAAALELPAGAVRTNEITLSPAEFARARFDGTKVPLFTSPGEMQVEAWQIIGNEQTNFQLLTPLLDQLSEQGYQQVFRCQAVSCGGYDFRFEVGKFGAPDLFIDLSAFQYATLRKGDDFVGLLVSHGGTDGFVQISRSQTDSPPTSVSTTPARNQTFGDLGTELNTHGHVVLTEVSFDTGSSTLAAGSNAQLEDLAQFLTDAPNARLALVGHTDAEGSLEGNIALSRKRAASVRARLIEEYGISPTRLQAEGVGYLSPIASNLTAEGRELNRRVEAVLLNTE
ncbi:OmpA family protein [Aliiroseovarius crassostreae]|uniref:OmpA family protein n=1 Tax=Aliiroseovarius crassostreae TaxID=154981 RepID=UPI00220F9A18|nr:OmpA family protein [Aliiroseovarius crassostreae]UWP98057.1 OmpA family protein [Aliiroseovarius crassostreae]